MKSGQINKAWSLFSTAARMCLDLGYHRPTPGAACLDNFHSWKVFWYIYVMEKGVALTLGRPANLHLGDIASDPMSFPHAVLGIPGKIAIALFELCNVEDEMLLHLFSAAAPVDSGVRQEAARGYQARIAQIHARMKTVSPTNLCDVRFEADADSLV